MRLPRYKTLQRSQWVRRAGIVRKHTYTGPSATVRMKVRVRADHLCEWPGCGRVGVDPHHRLNRKQGGRHGARKEQINGTAWVLLACREHHNRVTSAYGAELDEAKAMGWVLQEHEDALEVAVHTSHGWVLLDDKGSYEVLPGPPEVPS